MIRIPYLSNREIDLDEWLRSEIIDTHFHPTEGTPYWLERQKKFDFDIKNDINSVEDLYLFGPSDENLLRDFSIPPEYFIPKKKLKEGKSAFIIGESSGTTGPRKRIPWHKQTLFDMINYSDFVLDLYEFPKGKNFLSIGPNPLEHFDGWTTSVLEKYMEGLANRRGGINYYKGLSTEGAKKALESGNKKKIEEFFSFLSEEVKSIWENEKVGIVMSATPMLMMLPQYLDIENVKGVLFGGLKTTPEMIKQIRGIYKNSKVTGWYGNAFWGSAFHIDDGSGNLNYYSNFPNCVLEVTDLNNREEKVKYGEMGRVRFHILTKEFFWPNGYERDVAVRIPPNETFGWDGVRNVGPLMV